MDAVIAGGEVDASLPSFLYSDISGSFDALLEFNFRESFLDRLPAYMQSSEDTTDTHIGLGDLSVFFWF